MREKVALREADSDFENDADGDTENVGDRDMVADGDRDIVGDSEWDALPVKVYVTVAVSPALLPIGSDKRTNSQPCSTHHNDKIDCFIELFFVLFFNSIFQKCGRSIDIIIGEKMVDCLFCRER